MNFQFHNYPCVEKADLRSSWIFGMDQNTKEKARANLFVRIIVHQKN